MRCWNCKQDMPDGLKYCGHCGVHMKRSVYILQMLFTGKGLIVTLAVLLTVAGIFLGSRLLGNAKLIDVDMGYYTPRAEDVVYEDDEKTYGYVNNMLLVFVTRDATDRQIMRAVNRVDGEIVGVLPALRQYQIRVATSSREELEALQQKLMKFDFVKAVIIDSVAPVEQEVNAVPNDPWYDYSNSGFSTDWNADNPDGTNWWVEAAGVLNAWSYQAEFTPIKVGIVDGGFDLTHEDLSITVLNRALNDADYHGTHVAGIIGATHNNGVGISGVLPDVELYGVDCFQSSDLLHQANISTLLGGIDLCISQGCKVVNMSAGLVYGVPDTAQQTAIETALYLIMMLDAYDQEFLIIQAAGNGDNLAQGVDTEIYSGYFDSISRELVELVFRELDAMGVELETEVTVDDVMSSFMVVGNVDYERVGGNYQLAVSSNYGRNISVCAPGTAILSTYPMGSAYEYLSGTSMAAPVVSGVAAMVWSVDQDMTAAQVKDIILSTASEPVLSRMPDDYGTYRMINAEAAVEKALGVRANKPETPAEEEEGGFWDWLRNLFLWLRKDEGTEDPATQPTEEPAVMPTEVPTEEPTEMPTETTEPVDSDIPVGEGALLKNATTYQNGDFYSQADYTFDASGVAIERITTGVLPGLDKYASEYDEKGRLICRTIYYQVFDNNKALYAATYTYSYNADGNIDKIVCDLSTGVEEISFFYNNSGRLQRSESRHEDGSKAAYECELYNGAIYMKLVTEPNNQYRYGKLYFLDSVDGIYSKWDATESPEIVNGYVISAVCNTDSTQQVYHFEYEDASLDEPPAEDPTETPTEPVQDLSSPGYWVPVAQRTYENGVMENVRAISYGGVFTQYDGHRYGIASLVCDNTYDTGSYHLTQRTFYLSFPDPNFPERKLGETIYQYSLHGRISTETYTAVKDVDMIDDSILGSDQTISHTTYYIYDNSGKLNSARREYENGTYKVYTCEEYKDAYVLYHDNMMRIIFMDSVGYPDHRNPGYTVEFKNGYIKDVSPEGYILSVGIKNTDTEYRFVYDVEYELSNLGAK